MRILLATDGSPAAGLALDLVASVPWPDGSAIEVVEAVSLGPTFVAGPWAPIPVADTTAIEAAMRAYAQETVDAARARLERPGLDVSARVLAGRPATVIVDAVEAMQADLVVVGTRGHGRIGSMLVGSVSGEVIDQASAPVLLARRQTLSRVVLAWDGSACARVAADAVRTWPIFAGCAIHVVSVADLEIPWWSGVPVVDAGASQALYAPAAESNRQLHETYAREMAEELRAAGRDAVPEVRVGDAATEVIAAAEALDADLIVVGTRGRTGLTRLVLGSVARNVVQHAPCSVLVTRDAAVEDPACAPPRPEPA